MFIYSAYDMAADLPLYHAEAMVSAYSLRQHCDKPIVLHSNSYTLAEKLLAPDWSPFTDVVVADPPIAHPKLQKLTAIATSARSDTIFLDTDTFILGDLSKVFDFGAFDIAACPPPFRQSVASIEAAIDEEWDRRWKLNSGVIFMKGDQSRVIDAWLADYEARLATAAMPGKLMDQPSLQHALLKHRPDLFALPNNYNFRLCFGGYLSGACFVVHTHAGASIKPIAQDLHDLAAIEAVIATVAKINASMTGVSFPTMPDAAMADVDLNEIRFARDEVRNGYRQAPVQAPIRAVDTN